MHCVEAAAGASATFISSKSAAHSNTKLFTQAEFKKDTQHALWRLARETRKCPEVQSFAVNADELGPHGAGGNRLVVEASASRVQCRVQPLLAVQCRAPSKCTVQGSAFTCSAVQCSAGLDPSAVCRVQPFPFLRRPSGPDCPPASLLLCTSYTQANPPQDPNAHLPLS